MEENYNIEEQEQAQYSAANIQVLEGLEAVRKRPAMYIGDISEKGLHHLVYDTASVLCTILAVPPSGTGIPSPS